MKIAHPLRLRHMFQKEFDFTFCETLKNQSLEKVSLQSRAAVFSTKSKLRLFFIQNSYSAATIPRGRLTNALWKQRQKIVLQFKIMKHLNQL